MKKVAIVLVFGISAFAQAEEPKMAVNLDGFRYPRVARLNGIQGDVIFEISASGRRLVIGHPILSGPAEANLKTWKLPPLEIGKYLVSYHFAFVEDRVRFYKTVSIGGKFGRFFRRLVGLRTEEVVDACYSTDDPTAYPPPQYAAIADGDVKIDVIVSAVRGCVVMTIERSHF